MAETVPAVPRLRRALALSGAAALLAAIATLGAPAPAGAATADGAVLRYGPLTLGVNAYGDLNYACDRDQDTCPDNFYSTGDGDRTNVVGLRRTVDGEQLDATAPGGLNEGWGIADAGTQITGYSNQDQGGPNGLVLEAPFRATGNTATSVASAGSGEGAPRLQVTHVYGPSTDANLFQGTVTVTNTGNRPASDVRYRRVVDWDIAPTAFDEYVTLQGAPPELLFDSDGGFASADPLDSDAGARYIDSQAVCGEEYTGPCAFTDLGENGEHPGTTTQPDDHGALFDFALGPLDPGQSRTFKLFYGAATSESGALASLRAVGAETYSLGESACVGETIDTCDFQGGGDGGGEGGGRGLVEPGARRADGGRVVLAAGDAGPDRGKPATFMLGFVFARADLSLTKTGPAGPVDTGTTFTYSLAARNNTRGVTATGVKITDQLPAGTSFVSSSGGCSAAATVTCNLGSLAAFQTKTVTITVRATTPGTKVNSATVTANTIDPDATNNRASASTLVVQGNRAPQARNDTYGTDQDTELQVGAPGVQDNDTDADGDPLTTTLVSGPAHGTAILGSGGALRYVPDAGFSGTDSLRYRATDPSGASDTARVRITVRPTEAGTTVPIAPASPATDPNPPDVPTTDSPDVPTEAPTDEPSEEPTEPETPDTTAPSSEPAPSGQSEPVVGLRLSTPSVNPGGRLDASGSGCAANAEVRLSVDGADAGTGTAGGDGTFAIPVTAPDLPIGNHTVTALCGTLRQIAPVSFVTVTAASAAPGAQALTVGTVLAFFVLLLTFALRRPGR